MNNNQIIIEDLKRAKEHLCDPYSIGRSQQEAATICINKAIKEAENNLQNLHPDTRDSILLHAQVLDSAEIETFTGHAHTLKEDIDWISSIFDKIDQLMIKGSSNIRLPNLQWRLAALYNLRKATEFCEAYGITTFAEEKKHLNTYRPAENKKCYCRFDVEVPLTCWPCKKRRKRKKIVKKMRKLLKQYEALK